MVKEVRFASPDPSPSENVLLTRPQFKTVFPAPKFLPEGLGLRSSGRLPSASYLSIVQDHRRAVRPFADRHDGPIAEGRRSGDYANSAREWDNAPTRAVPVFAERAFEL